MYNENNKSAGIRKPPSKCTDESQTSYTLQNKRYTPSDPPNDITKIKYDMLIIYVRTDKYYVSKTIGLYF